MKKEKKQNIDEANHRKKRCMLCKLFGGNAASHTTKRCNKRSLIQRALDKGTPKNKTWQKPKNEELNAMIAKQVKTTLAKKGIAGSSDRENSA